MRRNQITVFTLVFIMSIGFTNASFGQGVQTSGGVNVDGSWYLGEGLKVGDYFEYSLCELDLNDCAPVKLKMWIRGEIENGSESLWDAEVAVFDGNKVEKGTIGLGKTAPEPVTFDDNLHDYAIAFKSSLSWLSAFATANEKDLIHGPKEFRDNAWGKIGAIGGSQLIPKRAETISVPAGTVDAVVVGWYSGKSNEIWIVDDFPFPVKATTYAWVTTGIAPIMYQFTLLDYKENVTEDPFADVESTIPKEELLGCPTKFYNYESGHVPTNTFSMIVQYNYSPQEPIQGCNLDWKINFMNKYNDVEFIDQVHYDIWVVDDNGNRLRSYAQEIGRADLFNGFGQTHILLPIEEGIGLAHYVIFIYGTGAEFETPDPTLGGYVEVDIDIGENPLITQTGNTQTGNTQTGNTIPEWIKNNAGWWSDGTIDDETFVQGIQFLIKEGILEVPSTTQESDSNNKDIPGWIKNNAGWWSDGTIDDETFVQGIQFLMKNGIIEV